MIRVYNHPPQLLPLSGIPYTYRNNGQAKLFLKSQKKILLYTLGIWYTISKISSDLGVFFYDFEGNSTV